MIDLFCIYIFDQCLLNVISTRLFNPCLVASPGRGKRKLDNVDIPGKKARIDQDLTAIESSTMAVITIDETPSSEDALRKSQSELYKALKQPPIDIKGISTAGVKGKRESKVVEISAVHLDSSRSSSNILLDNSSKPSTSRAAMGSITSLELKDSEQHKKTGAEIVCEKMQKATAKQLAEGKGRMSSDGSRAPEIKEIPTPPGPSNWLTPTSKKQADAAIRSGETVSIVQVIDEETRMSAESGSRSQTPARNIPAPGMHSSFILIL